MMKLPFLSSRHLLTRVRRGFLTLTTGGDWSLSHPRATRRNLTWFWLDGTFAAACDNIVTTYLALYVLALGASRAEIGFMSSLSSLSAALLLLPGALLVERIGRRKQISLLGGGLGRTALLLLALVPLAFEGHGLVWVAIALAVSRDAFNNLAFPAWMSLTAQIVPFAGRGRFFGSRNFAMGLSGILAMLLAGQLITQLDGSRGYQVAFAIAAGFGFISTYNFSRLRRLESLEPAPAPPAASLKSLLAGLKHYPGFVWLAASAALWNFSLNVAGPFFSVYQVQILGANATMVAITGIASSVTMLLTQRKMGELADRWGARRLQLASSLLIPLLPLAWALAREPWHIIPINLLSGVLWGGYSLASFNFLLSMIPAGLQARYSAIYQMIVMISLSVGAALGGLVVTGLGFIAVFIASGIGRWLAVLIFARFVPEAPAPPLPTIQEPGE